MGADDKIDKITGKAKKAAGEVTGDEDLANEGDAQEHVAHAKDSVKDAAQKVGDAVKDVAGAGGRDESGGSTESTDTTADRK